MVIRVSLLMSFVRNYTLCFKAETISQHFCSHLKTILSLFCFELKTISGSILSILNINPCEFFLNH